MSEFEGLCDNNHFDRYTIPDHWKGTSKRNSRKGPIEVAWNRVSASQIESFQKCKRSWYFKSVIKFPQEQKSFQGLGEAFHLINERVTQGQPWPNPVDVAGCSPDDWTKATQMANQFLPLFPTESKPFKREHGFSLPTYENGPSMVGYIDLAIPQGVGWPAFLVPATDAIVVDYKTLSDFRYMKTPQELADSVQMMTYAKWAIEPWPMGLAGENEPSPELIRVMHIYARTKPPFTRNSIRYESAIITPSEINSKWEKTLDTVREMEQVSACGNFEDVEADGALNGHCEAYGGCQFRDKCGIAKVSGIKSLFQIGKKPEPKETNTDMSGSAILEKIKAAQAAQALKAGIANPSVNTPVASVATTSTEVVDASPGIQSVTALTQADSPATSVVTSKGPVSALLAKMQGQGKGNPVLAGNLAQTYAKEQGVQGASFAGGGEYAKYTISNLGDLLKLSSGVVPPDAPSRRQDNITTPGTAVVDPEIALNPTGEEDDDETPENSADSSAPITQVVSDIPAPVKKRGRPSNAEIAARNAAAGIVQTPPQVSSVVAESGADVLILTKALEKASEEAAYYKHLADAAALATKHSPGSSPEGLTLYVDCFPTKGDKEVVDFFEWIGPICAQVAQANSVGDYRLINYTAKGLLASTIRETVKEHGTPKSITISSYAGGADIALEVLTPIAKRVIKKL